MIVMSSLYRNENETCICFPGVMRIIAGSACAEIDADSENIVGRNT